VAVAIVTLVYAAIPYVVASPFFYARGDSASQFLPTWFHFGELLRDGNWPLMDPGGWAGGNYAAEGLLGVYNPLNAVIWLVTSLLPDLLLAALVVKSGIMVMLALGTYFLGREYSAAPWAAASIAVALPFSGFALYWDGGSWPAGLLAFAYVPWVLRSFRRLALGKCTLLPAFLVGALAITQGNPYGVLGTVVAGMAVVVEMVVVGNRRALLRVLVGGGLVASLLPLVYLPLLSVVDLSYRGSTDSAISNNGFMRPALGDLFQLSAPTFLPDISTFRDPMRVPSVYLAWFVLPLLPWIDPKPLRRWRELTGILVFSLLYLLLTLGPQQLWLFRWPLRNIEYLYLGLGVIFAVCLSAGLRTDRWRVRLGVSAGAVLLTSFLTWAEHPDSVAARATLPMLVLLVIAVIVTVRRLGRRTALAGVLILGTGAVLLSQAIAFGENESSGRWHMPHDVSAVRDQFGSLPEPLIQFYSAPAAGRYADEAGVLPLYDHFLFGSMYDVAGIEAVNHYSGMGYYAFSKYLCLRYNGASQRCGLKRVFTPVENGLPTMARLMKLRGVVASASQYPDLQAPPGWHAEKQGDAWLLVRETRPKWPDSRLSWRSSDLRVQSARGTLDSERVQFTVEESVEQVGGDVPSRSLVFARLAWPGYTASVNGHEVPIIPEPHGLVQVQLPAGVRAGTLELSFAPPGLHGGLALVGLALVGAFAGSVLELHRRRSRSAEARA
jgi:hypothetical protein